MRFALVLLALICAALALPFLIPGAGQRAGVDPNRDLPWQIDVDGQGGSQVFGLQPGRSTLADARRVLGSDLELAIVAAPGEVGAVEAFYTQVPLGFVLAKMILTVDADPAAIIAMRERALKAEPMESATRKIRLHPDDRAAVEALPLRAISVIPTVNLDEATLVQRFGPPAERLEAGERRVHLLYPEKGVDIMVDAEGKELLQYVAPRQFELLRAPLRAVQGGKPSS